ncbi:IclR family transcriptional regulator [Rhodococcus chondri]|uniref:IclR family transcriptional regulator n=1 Tax=Rhodococcus chondri TaxID=3065941 RepID=A0ABU7JLC9_9NOCA|nr:IclR family transcriptional regulator [Rhodococcus sp. CC-R104]MEE2030517.1 IclR family transcriptional regulator [Rhodococcus sp. CC-R104]
MISRAQGQLVGRVSALLRTISSYEPDGASTSDLARATDLARPTVHRLLSSLADEGLVDRDPKSGRWALGPELYLLGSVAATRYDITDLAGEVLRDLARETGESAFLSARRGDETVCLASEEGSFPLRSHVLHIGIRFPLGVASAGLAILAHMSDHDIDEYLSRVDLTAEWGADHSRAAIEERIAATRLAGFSVNPALIVEGSWGMGAAVFDHRGAPTWALSITGVESRFRAERLPDVGALLLSRAHRLTQLLRHRAR